MKSLPTQPIDQIAEAFQECLRSSDEAAIVLNWLHKMVVAELAFTHARRELKSVEDLNTDLVELRTELKEVLRSYLGALVGHVEDALLCERECGRGYEMIRSRLELHQSWRREKTRQAVCKDANAGIGE